MKEMKGDISSLKGDLTSINETISQQYETTRSLNETVKGLSEDLVEHKNQTTSELAGLQTTLQSFTNNTELVSGAVLLTRLPYTTEEMNLMTDFTNLISEGASKLKINLDEHRNQTTYELADLQSSMDTLDSKLVSLNVSVTEELRSLNDQLDAKLDELPQNMTELKSFISEKATSIDESVSGLSGVLEMYKNWTMSELADLQNALQSFITTAHSGLLTELSTKILSQNFSSLQSQINAMVNPHNSTLAAVNATSTLTREDLSCVKADLSSLKDLMNRVCDKVEEHEDHMTAELMELNKYLKENLTHQISNNDNLEEYTCGGTRGWRRAVYLDMTDPNTTCSSGLRKTRYSKRTCGIYKDSGGFCGSVTFPVSGGEYNQMCGRIKAYQWGTAAGFRGYRLGYNTIDDAYFSGVAVMHGSPRQHIWTFAIGSGENNTGYWPGQCPCDSSSGYIRTPPFVGEDYFCESGYIGPGYRDYEAEYTLHSNDTLWDGKDCFSTSTCCSRHNHPFFTKTLSTPTNDNIELRRCGLYGSLDNVAIELIELYVKENYIEPQLLELDQRMKQSFAHQIKNINNLGVHTCGGTGGWRRAVYLDMTDPSIDCPSGWNMTGYSKRTCGRVSTTGLSCDSVTFPVSGGEYSQVCGRIKAYQWGQTGGFSGYRDGYNTIDYAYFSGVAVMHGSPRQHIWTFAAGINENYTYGFYKRECPCDEERLSIPIPPFVGEDYFCESGYIYPGYWHGPSLYTLHSNDTLWDGRDCHSSSTCCSHHNPPYFTKTLNTTTDDIELRVCGIWQGDDENVAVELIELYVQ